MCQSEQDQDHVGFSSRDSRWEPECVDQERSQQSGDEPEGAGGELHKQARVEGDRGGRSVQRPGWGVQDDREGKVRFEEKKGKGAAGNQIEQYSIAQTISHLNETIVDKYNNKKDKAKAKGKSTTASEDAAQAMANKLPKFTAVQMWLDDKAEIDLNKALERMITKLEISALIQVH